MLQREGAHSTAEVAAVAAGAAAPAVVLDGSGLDFSSSVGFDGFFGRSGRGRVTVIWPINTE